MPTLLDVNVVIALLVTGHPQHGAATARYEEEVRREETVLLPEEVCASFVRITSFARAFPTVGDGATAMALLKTFLARSEVAVVRPAERRMTLAFDLIGALKLSAGDVPDAFLAAFAQEQGATLMTFDRGFARFPDLSVEILPS